MVALGVGVRSSDSGIFQTPETSDAEEDAAAGPPPKMVQRFKISDEGPVSSFAEVKPRHRFSSCFPEGLTAGTDTIGAWRMTKVNGMGCGLNQDFAIDGDSSNSWLLLGRRHSVDERREQADASKRLFRRTLAAEIDAPWHQRAESQSAELSDCHERLQAELARQVELVTNSKNFWCGSFAASRAFLSSLERVAGTVNESSLLPETRQSAAEQVEYARKAAVQAEAWALWLPRVCENHAAAVEDVTRTLARAMQGTEVATGLAHSRREVLFPARSGLAGVDPTKSADLILPWRTAGAMGHTYSTTMAEPPSKAESDNEDICLWLVACQYLASSEALEDANQAALSQLLRQEKQIALLSQWVDEALSGTSLEGQDAPIMLGAASLSPKPSSYAFLPSGAPLSESVNLAALVVHEVDVEVCREYPRETSSDSAWAPVHLLLSVDLRLHIWEKPGMDCHLSVAPSDSIDLLRDCNRPVAVRSSNVVQIAVRPDEVKSGLMSSMGRVLWNGGAPRPPRRGLQFRCGDEIEAAELLAAFDLIEQRYPSAESFNEQLFT